MSWSCAPTPRRGRSNSSRLCGACKPAPPVADGTCPAYVCTLCWGRSETTGWRKPDGKSRCPRCRPCIYLNLLKPSPVRNIPHDCLLREANRSFNRRRCSPGFSIGEKHGDDLHLVFLRAELCCCRGGDCRVSVLEPAGSGRT